MVAYAYLRNDLKTHLIFGVDPFYSQNLVPSYAAIHGVVASSSLDLTKRLRRDVEFRHNVSKSKFKPNASAAPDTSNFSSAAFGADFSQVDVPQLAAGKAFEYHFGTNF
jgi:hypothetical protein